MMITAMLQVPLIFLYMLIPDGFSRLNLLQVTGKHPTISDLQCRLAVTMPLSEHMATTTAEIMPVRPTSSNVMALAGLSRPG